MKSLAFVAVALLSAVNAANVTFKVIAPTATKQVQVNIDGTLTALKAADSDVPYYTGSADLPDNKPYKVRHQSHILQLQLKLTFPNIVRCWW